MINGTTSILIRVPAPYPALKPVVEHVGPELLVQHAPDGVTYVNRALLGWAFTSALRSARTGDFLVASTTRTRTALEFRLAGWLASAGVDTRARNGCWTIGNSRLWLWDIDKLDDIPIVAVEDAALLDLHTLESHQSPRLFIAERVTGRVRMAGETAGDHHWWSKELSASFNRVKITVEDAPLSPRIDVIKAVTPEAEWRLRYLCDAHVDVTRSVSTITLFRRRLRIRDKAGNEIPFVANGRQRSYIAWKRLLRRHLREKGLPFKVLVLKYRRGGITTCEQGESYEACVNRPNTTAITLAHTREATQQIFRIAQLYHRKDPDAPRLKGTGNASRLEFPGLNSVFNIGTAKASGLSRGDTLQRVHGSEVSKWFEGTRAFDRARDLVAGLTEAASHGEVILETTANGNEWFAHTYREARAHRNDWTPIFMPWFSDKDNRLPFTAFDTTAVQDTLDDREKDLIAKHDLGLSQIAWRRSKVLALGALFPQEYPEDDETCFLTHGICLFDVGNVSDRLEELDVEDPCVKPILGGYEAEWKPPVPGRLYVAGCDTSEGVVNAAGEGGDPNGTGILDYETGEQVAAIHGHFPPKELARRSVSLCKRYNHALLGVERNNHGHAVLLEVDALNYTSAQDELYYSVRDERPGWITDGLTRPILLDGIREAVDERLMTIHDRQLLKECLTFRRQTSGKYEASGGDHDDAVIKWAIAWQMRLVPRITSRIEVM